MTQSGQGEEPSAQPAREGIVLPSDGGEPLLPGQTGRAGGSTAPAGGHGAAPAPGPGGQAAPAGGQSWGQPWGPGQSAQTPPPAQGWGGDAGQQWSAPGQTTAPDWGAQGAQSSWEASDSRPAWRGDEASQQPQSGPGQPLPPQTPQPGAGAGPLPPEGTQASYGADAQSAPQGAQDARHGAQPLPHATHSAPLPPASGAAPLPPATGAPLPTADEAATQYLSPVATAPDEGATQYIPPVAATPDQGATQYLPPVGPGMLPAEAPGDEATRFLGRAVGGPPPSAGPDAQATQYLPPVPGHPGPAPYGVRPGAPGGDRQPPTEFDNLFRSDAGGARDTQNLPRFDAAGAPGAPAGRAAGRLGDDDGGGTRSRVPLIAAVGVGIVALGIGAGALLGGGGDTGGKTDNSKTVSATGPAADASGSGAGDPAKQQAVALDKLLADSGNSRGSVIKAVADVKACQNLGQAAADLRNAADQRNGLVTQLSGLAVDKLPQHAELTAALTTAWKASAEADTHYAAWADQVSRKKGCKDGHARDTGQAEAGNRASGTASAQKTKAASLWNAIAQQYGLTQRQPVQL
ncbi:hypothetical protein AAW14_10255 [Streptomyces hygroscopicus]|uniref:hypothetical protein n=1 Tax=Streptomyces hygroscopicus TaxID=1912 RepID=UPI00223ED8ED|nr:hypothetical protein [Streptomyces hygroscopicus]MCW7942405.1 hypothetical protein [Streptomyces hygroscopicus]